MRTVVGVMGGGEASPEIAQAAYELGRLIAARGWVLLNGGRDCGVMDASARGAKEAGGITVGVLPGDDLAGASPHLDIALPTGLGDGRNFVNVTASRVIVALPGGAGTLSEVALALKQGKTVVTLRFDPGGAFNLYAASSRMFHATTPEEAVEIVARVLGEGS